MLTTETEYQEFTDNLHAVGIVRTNEGDWKAMRYSDFLREYCSDETTTPHGIAPRLFIRDKDDADPPQLEIRRWRPDGKSEFVEEFYEQDHEKAEAYLFHLWEGNKERANAMFFTPMEAADELGTECAMITKDLWDEESLLPERPLEDDIYIFCKVFSFYLKELGQTIESVFRWQDEVQARFKKEFDRFCLSYSEEMRR